MHAFFILFTNTILNLSGFEMVMHQSIPAVPIPPPGNCGAFAHAASPGGGAFAILSPPRRLGISIPRGDFWAFDTRVFERQISFFYREGRGLCQRLSCPTGTKKTCRCFSRYVFSILNTSSLLVST